mgnify:CR=1 FL=1
MAIVRKYLAKDNYTKVDNIVACNKNIPDYAFRLYTYMSGFRNAFQLNDGYIRKALGWSQEKITRAKRELKKEDLIYIEKIDARTYFLYIGSSRIPASKVMKNWDKLEEQPQ